MSNEHKMAIELVQLHGVSAVDEGPITTVFLEEDSKEVRDRVNEVIQTYKPNTKVAFEVIGKIELQAETEGLAWDAPGMEAPGRPKPGE